MFYLETSSLRRLSGKITNPEILKKCFTSGLSIFELLSGMTEEEYDKRRTILKKFIDSEINIIWALPNEMLKNAFPDISFTDVLSNTLREIVQVVLESASFIKANQMCGSSNLLADLESLARLDEHLSGMLNSIYIHGSEFMKNQIGRNKLKAVYRFTKELESNFSDELRVAFNAWRQWGIISQIAINLCMSLEIDGWENQLERILNSYSGSLQFYYEAISHYVEKMIMEDQIPGKNHGLDLSHFLYMENNITVKMVSDDKFIKGICNGLWPRKYRSSKDILDLG